MHTLSSLQLSFKKIPAICLIAIISACSNIPNSNNNSDTNYKTLNNAGKIAVWKNKLEQDPQSANLHIGQLYADSNNFKLAKRHFSIVKNDQLPSALAANYIILQARLLEYDRKPRAVLNLLDNDNIDTNLLQQLQIGLLKARSLESIGNHIESAQQRVFIANSLQGQQLTHNYQSLWQSLAKVDSNTLEAQARASQSGELRGWLTLALIQQRFAMQPLRQHEQLAIWRNEWNQHPAHTHMPEAFAQMSQISTQRPEKICLLLPLTGPLANAGLSVRDGFLAAALHADDITNIEIVDSNSINDLTAFYQQLKSNGTELLVGPLSKKRVQQLNALGELPIKTLALNYNDSALADARYYQFGLSNSDETHQITPLALSHDYKNAMVIYPAGVKGNKLFQTFNEDWTSAGGRILETMSFVSRDNYVKALESALQVDRSKQRAQILTQQLAIPLEATPRRRKDIDFIFLAAKADAARSIKPMLAFHYASDLPVLSTSQVFNGTVQAHKDRDLNGIVYTEMPWMLSNDNELWTTTRKALANTSTMPRLFTLGLDAFDLSNKLEVLGANPNINIIGASGKLSMDALKRINRTLNFAKIMRGIPRTYHLPTLE